MITQNDYIKIISKKTGEPQYIVLLILKEYAKICINLMINSDQVEFPKEFGTGEIVSKPWTEASLKKQQEKDQNFDYRFRDRTNFKLNRNKYEMKIYGVGKLAATLKFVSQNKLKKFRYVDK